MLAYSHSTHANIPETQLYFVFTTHTRSFHLSQSLTCQDPILQNLSHDTVPWDVSSANKNDMTATSVRSLSITLTPITTKYYSMFE